MTNVPVSRQQAPPGPATPSAQQAPGECLRVSVSGTELWRAPGFQKIAVFRVPPQVTAPWTWEGTTPSSCINELQVAVLGVKEVL